MSRFSAILYGMSIVIIALLFARESVEPIIYLFKEHQTKNTALGITGLIISTFVPLALSICVWINISKLKARWFVHLIFILFATIIFTAGSSLFFYGANVSGDNSPEGYSLFVASAFLSIALLVHTIALFAEAYKHVRYRVKGR